MVCLQETSGNGMRQSSALLDEYRLQDMTEEAPAAPKYDHMVSSIVNKFPKEVKLVL